MVTDIAGRKVGLNQRCFIIAKAGVNHNGRIKIARQFVDAVANAEAVNTRLSRP